ncbi:two-component regulator propeller domain-containing protein [Arcticibacter sp. MXS-1]|uniref:two-component regulator propeller domain-containing protein n=1 Tax=Arcticibacter sp. MXS-1 TaxID=3341726 RepID=UPI0035A887CD
MLKRIYILLCYAFLSIPALKAQTSLYQFSQLNTSQGLSHNQVTSIFQDERGFMWFGTVSGLNRYDGYSFKTFRHVLKDSTSINDDNILNIRSGPDNKLWIQTRMGFVFYDPISETFDRKPAVFLKRIGIGGSIIDIREEGKGNYWIATTAGLYRYPAGNTRALLVKAASAGSQVTSIFPDRKGSLWIAYNTGKVETLSQTSKKVVWSIRPTNIPETALYQVFVDSDNEGWVYSSDRPQGVWLIDSKGKVKRWYTRSGSEVRLNTNNIYCVNQDSKGRIWIGTDHGGINVLSKGSDRVFYLLNRETDGKSLAQNTASVIYKDRTGIMWVGTFKKGISYYHDGIIKFPLFRHVANEQGSLPYDDVNRFVEDRKGNLWIGTNGGGLIYFNRQNNRFTRYRHDAADPNSLSNDVIVSLCIDSREHVWIGSYFGGLDQFDGKRFIHHKKDPADPAALTDDRIWEIMEASDRRLWVGTLAGGLNILDQDRKLIRKYRSGKGNTIRSNYISALIEDRRGNVWVGTDNGLDVWQRKTNTFRHFRHSETDEASLSNDFIISLLEDSRGLVWVGTQDGLNIFDPKTQRFSVLRAIEGLPANTILTILEDRRGDIWVSTPNGLSNVSVSGRGTDLKFGFRNYDESDGLQGRQFNENAALKTRKGELIFGGPNGFNIFNPGDIKVNNDIPRVVLTGFELFNAAVKPGEKVGGRLILNNSITESRELKLNYDQNVFSIEFAALNFSNAPKNKYSYILEGFNKKWLTSDATNRKATFTNLDPGEYTFKVKASNDSGVWNHEGASIKITILPPFWRTPMAYILYAVFVLAFLFYLRKRGIDKLREQFALEQERQEVRRMHQLDLMKIKFFTNVSHEFRTPLSLILSPLETLLKNPADTAQEKHLQLIQRNARRLLNLVNQLMDFRKMEVNELRIQPQEGDVIVFIRDSFQSFTDLAEKKRICFSFFSPLSSVITSFDHDKIERILFNLLSNAFKFTPDGGTISLTVQLDDLQEKSGNLVMRVEDNGIGIPQEKQHSIFERFFQSDVPGSIVNQGSGIGLAITKEFVNLHGGTIRVMSEPDKGSCFVVTLPLNVTGLVWGDMRLQSDQVAEAGFPEAERTPESTELSQGDQKKRKILLIEDNEDFRFYLKDNLKQHYQVLEAANGKTGWSKTLSEQPDLVVSDISMPEMNGIDLCVKIRGDKRTSHIPVILLTAMTGEELMLRGLETGASDYMTKPFNFEVLISKIRNLCKQQESMRKTYQRQVEARPSEVEVESADEKFIKQALGIIEKNIPNTEFSVEELSREMAMSRVALYKKLLQLTRQTPVEFIRSIRLKRAAQLLEKSQCTVSEIAYETGFNNPKAFARYFKAEFGVLPSSWARHSKDREAKKG